jgi:hypothetical protein
MTFTAKMVRRAEIPLPWYLHRRFTARQIRAACENYIDPSSSITVTRTRTRAVFNRETVLTTRTYTRRSKEATTTTKFRSTSTVTATETTTVRHPCDYLFRATHVESWSVNSVSPDLAAFEINTDSVGETKCCRRCWDESQCNGWMYFQNKDCYRLVGSSGPGATDTCPNGFVHFDTLVSSSAPGGDIIGQGPCGHLSATK